MRWGLGPCVGGTHDELRSRPGRHPRPTVQLEARPHRPAVAHAGLQRELGDMRGPAETVAAVELRHALQIPRRPQLAHLLDAQVVADLGDARRQVAVALVGEGLPAQGRPVRPDLPGGHQGRGRGRAPQGGEGERDERRVPRRPSAKTSDPHGLEGGHTSRTSSTTRSTSERLSRAISSESSPACQLQSSNGRAGPSTR